MEYSKKFGENIKHEREKRGFTVELAAGLIGKTPEEIEMIENGEFEDLDDIIIKLADMYSISLEDAFMGNYEEREETERIRQEKIAQILSCEDELAVIMALKKVIDMRNKGIKL